MEVSLFSSPDTYFISRNCPSPEPLAAMAAKVDCIKDYPRASLTLGLPVHREILFPPGHCIRIMNLVKPSRSSNLMMPNRWTAVRRRFVCFRGTDSIRAHYRAILRVARSRWYLREYSSGKFLDRMRCFKVPS